ncbi:MAG: hypothetical protein ACREUT_15505 [Steroidobacteraceae bacterium]
MERFSVFQFFPDETYEAVRRFVPGEEAVKAALHYCSCVGAKLGTTVRVIITDGADHTVFEWQRLLGITFGADDRLLGRFKNGIDDRGSAAAQGALR